MSETMNCRRLKASAVTQKSADDAERHARKMAARKAVQDAEVASKTITDKGLLLVHGGAGKGKSTAAFGLMLRAVGHGRKTALVQFVKGGWDTGEVAAIRQFSDLVDVHVMGEGFTWNVADKARDVAAAERAWAVVEAQLARPELFLLVLDELNIVLRYGYLDVDRVVATLASRRPSLHVCVTGRNPPPALIDAADCVTDMTMLKHHFKAGVRAQEGIEF